MTDSTTRGGSAESRPVPDKAREKGQEAAEQAQDRAREAAGRVQERAKQELDESSTQAGRQVRTFAQAVRKAGEELSNQGNQGGERIAQQAAERLEGMGGYLSAADADRILSDLEEFARRQPWIVAAGAGLLGVIAARFLKASSDQGTQQAPT